MENSAGGKFARVVEILNGDAYYLEIAGKPISPVYCAGDELPGYKEKLEKVAEMARAAFESAVKERVEEALKENGHAKDRAFGWLRDEVEKLTGIPCMAMGPMEATKEWKDKAVREAEDRGRAEEQQKLSVQFEHMKLEIENKIWEEAAKVADTEAMIALNQKQMEAYDRASNIAYALRARRSK